MRIATKSGAKSLGIDVTDPFVALVLHGGFLYFDVKNQLVGATAINHGANARCSFLPNSQLP
jgi:hypothetical protein